FGGPVQDEDLAQVVHRGAGELLADPVEQFVARGAVFASRPDLDQAVGREIAVDFLEYGVAQPLVANEDDGLERVGSGPQGAAQLGIEVKDWHFQIVREAGAGRDAWAAVCSPYWRLARISYRIYHRRTQETGQLWQRTNFRRIGCTSTSTILM